MDVLSFLAPRPATRTAIATFLALLIVVPGFASAGNAEFPDDLTPLARKWIDEARAAGAGHEGREWYPQAYEFLEKAEAALDEGRLRVVLFDLETYHQLVETGKLMDEAAALRSDAERKGLVSQRTTAWAEDARHEWTLARERLDAIEDDLRSLQAVERALYAADLALTARTSLNHHALLAKEFPNQPKFEEGYVLALVSSSHTPVVTSGWAIDLIETVAALEGLQPSIDLDAWHDLTLVALEDPGDRQLPPYYEPYEELAKDVRPNNESIMAMAIYLAELREARKSSIHLIFGDGQSRAKDAVNDSASGLRKQGDLTSMSNPRDYGLQGIFTADALDRVAYTLEFVERGEATLGVVIGTWAALDHSAFVIEVLGQVSPIQPAAVDVEEKPTPGFAPALAALAFVAAAGIAGARTRGRGPQG